MKPVRVVSFVFEQPRLDSSLGSLSLSLSPHPFSYPFPVSFSPSSSFYIHRATSVPSLSSLSASLSLSFLLPLFWFPYIGASRKSRILGHPVFSIFRFARDTLSRPPRRRPVPRVACCLSDTKERIEPHSAVEPAKDERRRSRGDVMHSPR